MDRTESLPLGVVVEWRRVEHPWKDHDWRPVAVIAGAPALEPRGPWKLLREGEGVRQYHAGTLPLELFRSDTPGYEINLLQQPPRVYVVLRQNSDPAVEHEVIPYLVTANAYETEHYAQDGDEIVEAVAMPAEVVALVDDFVKAHPTNDVFVKRKRKGAKGAKAAEADPFSRRPPVERPRAGSRREN